MARLCARLVDTRSWPWSARPVRASRRWYGPVCCRRWRPGCCPGSSSARQHLLAPGRCRCRCSTGAAVVVVDQFEEVFADDHRRCGARHATSTSSRRSPPARIPGSWSCCAAISSARAPRMPGWPSCSATAPCWSGRCARRRSAARSRSPPGTSDSSEPALVDAIVSDMQDAPGALPLMSTALVEVWQRPRRRHPDRGGVPPGRRRVRGAGPARRRRPSAGWTNRRRPRRGGSCCGWRRPVRAACWCGAGCPGASWATTRRPERALTRAGQPAAAHRRRHRYRGDPRGAADELAAAGRLARRGRAGPGAAPASRPGRGRVGRHRRPDTELYRGARLASALDWAGDRLAELTDVEAGLPRRQPRLRRPRTAPRRSPEPTGRPGRGAGWSPRSPPRSACSWSPPAPPGRR